MVPQKLVYFVRKNVDDDLFQQQQDEEKSQCIVGIVIVLVPKVFTLTSSSAESPGAFSATVT